MRLLAVLIIQICFFLLLSSSGKKHYKEEQVTHNLCYNHDLDNNDNFSPDSEWLVYDTRTKEGGIGACGRIEKVNIRTREKVVLYEIRKNKRYGPGVGAVSFNPVEDKVIFIHGLSNASKDHPYEQWRRTGVIIEAKGDKIYMDSRDVTFPFTPGALRGGTHRHEWSGDGKWIGYTYNDAIMKSVADSTNKDWNLRTIGVSRKVAPTPVDYDGRNENVLGTWFSVIVVRVVPYPKPGSDEISRAEADSWVGVRGYQLGDGTYQRARAFIGTVITKDGSPAKEVFIVDIPEEIQVPGNYGPLEGTRNSFPMPPAGTIQRRLTYTVKDKFPGCEGVVRSSPDGKSIAFRARDKYGIKQIFSISPHGGEPKQITFHESDVESGVRWHPEGRQICYIWNNSIMLERIDQESKNPQRLTAPSDPPPSDPVWSRNGKVIAYNKMEYDESKQISTKQIFVIHL